MDEVNGRPPMNIGVFVAAFSRLYRPGEIRPTVHASPQVVRGEVSPAIKREPQWVCVSSSPIERVDYVPSKGAGQ